ncbi:MAG TPA: hypothetical protein VE650_08855, partial [Acetobacteraceae bacterium]|nr:hypothetical protein [Acetobacteraceae bacterium]
MLDLAAMVLRCAHDRWSGCSMGREALSGRAIAEPDVDSASRLPAPDTQILSELFTGAPRIAGTRTPHVARRSSKGYWRNEEPGHDEHRRPIRMAVGDRR